MNEEEKESIKNLEKYIEEDFAYREPIKNYSDFDKFCYNHCKNIETVLNLIEKLRERLKLMDDYNYWVQLATNRGLELEKLQKEVTQNYISKQKIKDLMGEKEWAIKSYDCSEADYNQSQAVGAWFACQRLLEERKK